MNRNKPTSIVIQGAWHHRKETPLDGIICVRKTFHALSSLHDEYKSWFNPSFCDETNQPLDMSVEDNEPNLYDYFTSKGGTYDEDGKIIRSLGYGLSAYSGTKHQRLDMRTAFSVACCRTSEANLDNNIYIHFPIVGPEVPALTENIDVHLNIMKCILETWQPDWLSTRYVIGESCKLWPFGPSVGWINFFSTRIAQIEFVPQGWDLVNFNGFLLYVYKDGIPSVDLEEAKHAFKRLRSSARRIS